MYIRIKNIYFCYFMYKLDKYANNYMNILII